MARIRSIVIRTEIDVAQRAHNCQSNARHRIERGSMRFKVRNGRGWDHYCVNCAKLILERDIKSLDKIAEEIKGNEN